MEPIAETQRRRGDAPAPMVRTARLKLPDSRGLHGREAAMLVKLERSFNADLLLECGEQRSNAKSILGLLSLEAGSCTDLLATATGPEADRLIRAIEELFASGFRSTAQTPAASLFRSKFAAHFNLAH